MMSVFKHEGVPVSWGEYSSVLIVQILFSLKSSLAVSVRCNVASLWFDFMSLLCSATNLPETLSLQDSYKTFLDFVWSPSLFKIASGFV